MSRSMSTLCLASAYLSITNVQLVSRSSPHHNILTNTNRSTSATKAMLHFRSHTPVRADLLACGENRSRRMKALEPAKERIEHT